jgi:hypothetical protein
MSETGAAKINCAVGFRLVDHDLVVVYIQGEKQNYLPVVNKGARRRPVRDGRALPEMIGDTCQCQKWICEMVIFIFMYNI